MCMHLSSTLKDRGCPVKSGYKPVYRLEGEQVPQTANLQPRDGNVWKLAGITPRLPVIVLLKAMGMARQLCRTSSPF